jgi:hypothetical protein
VTAAATATVWQVRCTHIANSREAVANWGLVQWKNPINVAAATTVATSSVVSVVMKLSIMELETRQGVVRIFPTPRK